MCVCVCVCVRVCARVDESAGAATIQYKETTRKRNTNKTKQPTAAKTSNKQHTKTSDEALTNLRRTTRSAQHTTHNTQHTTHTTQHTTHNTQHTTRNTQDTPLHWRPSCIIKMPSQTLQAARLAVERKALSLVVVGSSLAVGVYVHACYPKDLCVTAARWPTGCGPARAHMWVTCGPSGCGPAEIDMACAQGRCASAWACRFTLARSCKTYPGPIYESHTPTMPRQPWHHRRGAPPHTHTLQHSYGRPTAPVIDPHSFRACD